VDDGQTALLLDDQGLVLAGVYVDDQGRDVAQDVGAQLSGVSDEVKRATRHLGMGNWQSIVFETQAAVVAMRPAAEETLLMLAVSRGTPIGLVRRLLDRCTDRARSWMGQGAGGGS
jgi:predicted regulator of Ras-like GTPase activity (Roadblock/LC7/MglB family)